jgi:hypothetical protein
MRDTASVSVKSAVDGTVKRRKPRKGQRAVIEQYHVKVDPRVWATAKKLCGPYQFIKIVNEEMVVVANGD